MRILFAAASLAGLCLAGCGSADNSTADSNAPPAANSALHGPGDSSSRSRSERDEPLTPENLKIEFVGTHAPPKEPDPRTGTFTKFSGTATVDKAAKTLNAVKLEIDTASFTTFNEKLTTHLQSPEFLDAREFPTISFVSKKIEPTEDGKQQTITGDLTLHGVTKEISFPATVVVEDNDLKINATFTIDRTEFGMDQLLEGVEKEVTINVVGGKQE